MGGILRTEKLLWGREGNHIVQRIPLNGSSLEAHRHEHSGESCEEQGAAMSTGL